MGFQQGLSGLNAAAKNLDVIGNNVANASTVGFKASRAEFQDIYAAALNGAGVNQIGIGVNLGAVAQQFTQGNISTTENPLDLAINGPGFFQVTDGVNPTVYTRNGQFKISREGYIVNNDGLKLLGYPADGTGVIQPGIAGVLQLPTAGIAPQRTNDITLEFNVDSRVPITLPAAGGIILNDPTTYNNATSLSVYDTKGQDTALTLYFQKASVDATTGDTTWNVYATANGTPVAVDSAGNGITLDAAGNPQQPWTTIVFPRDGGAPTTPNALVNLDIPASVNAQGAPALDIAGIQVNLLGANENASPFAVTNVLQDGYAPGQLSGILIESNGIVTARYSNGQSKPAGQLEMANFRNPQGLQPLGGNTWARTFASGDAVLGTPSVGNFGKLQSGSLEDSNTDLTLELVNMVTAQRIYQANAQTIRTQDQVLQTIVQLR
ncbi:flagellar hook protein FlgE [Inhella crocodyli]|jgi:flagellar hook protein FlgE|uniref:Flagellar hook protein FlgE n=1 Tax=Inhella crocodyli TaxID=2499851 RepID=A0A437LCT9_9BURK|nr:flagellar hook protein FlgE [Inhella crocodyli]RVT83129.1 flagellar hook protein FlgE [Inhella crocodyli]